MEFREFILELATGKGKGVSHGSLHDVECGQEGGGLGAGGGDCGMS